MVPSGGPRARLAAEVKVALSSSASATGDHTFGEKDDGNNTEYYCSTKFHDVYNGN